MSWFQSVDVALFRFINLTLRHPILDAVMPFFAWNPFFVPMVVIVLGGLIWKGGRRGLVFVALLLVILALGDMLLINTIKQAIGRLRPFHNISDAHLLVGKGDSASMPSSHASTWFAATLIAFVYYPWSVRFMLPLAMVVGLSRIYVGVHYPSDVASGGLLGAGYAAAGLWAFNFVWQRLGRAWFYDWWRRMPSLLKPEIQVAETVPPVETAKDFTPALSRPGGLKQNRPVAVDVSSAPSWPASPTTRHTQWLRLGYVVIAALFFARLGYLASGKIELSEDEAYQWIWSKHLALSYYSKPPLIAYTQFLGTTLWGDNEFGVRFFSPVIAALLSFLLLRFMGENVSARAGFWLVLIVSCTPLLAVGTILMTIDPLLVLFWIAAMIAGWRAVQPDSRTGTWLWVGLWMGLGFLSKYSALFQIVCWAVFFALWPPARKHLRRPGPWLALLVTALCMLPVVIWNAQHDWSTIEHVAFNARRSERWDPTVPFFWEFLGVQAGLLHPVFFVAMMWVMIVVWRRERQNSLMTFFFSMGAPVFLGYMLFSLYKRVFPNWIVPAVLPLFCLMVTYWERRWPEGRRWIKPCFAVALISGFAAVLLLHDTNLITKFTGYTLPANRDPLRRVRGWSNTAQAVNEARVQQLLAEDDKVFIIGNHYGLVSEISFYLPAAKRAVADSPLVYQRTMTKPSSQFYFWPGYRHRKGQNAIYVQEVKRPQKPPPDLVHEFETVTDLGLREIKYRGRVLRTIQLFACHKLR
jgi:membrane-associated phospholipid phosphatase